MRQTLTNDFFWLHKNMNCVLPLKSNLAKLKAEVDKIDIYKLKTVPVDLSELSNVVNNEVVKKIVYEKLVKKINNIVTSGFV